MPTTPLRDAHAALGARFTDFGGWDMPVQYEGVLAEHMTVRQGVGVFDVSHLGRFRLQGAGAAEAIGRQFCNDIHKVGAGRAQYTMALNEEGGVVDDIIVWRFADDDFWIMPNGVNFDELLDRFADEPDTVSTPVRDDTVLLAVQGPQSREVVSKILGAAPGRFRVTTGEFDGRPMWMAGTGYTGEQGAEIAVPGASAPKLFGALIDTGATPCGLGSRDTLRLEMGYPLWGQDLDEATTPLHAGLGWVVAWDHDFVGKGALLAQKGRGLDRKLISFQTSDRRPPRHGYALRSGTSTGFVSSGNFSPVLEVGIGMGYMAPPPPDEQPLEMEVRGTWQLIERVELPFIKR